MADLDFQSCGGRAEALMNAGANPMDPNNLSWNFGLVTANEPANAAVAEMIQDKPTLYTRFPNMAGRWNGKTVNHWAAVRAVLGDDKADTLIQHQPRGTCGGRAGSLAIDMLQCVLIALGKRAKFKRASHAFLYWQARKKYGMDRGQPWDDRNDGVASGSIPEIMASVGIDTRDETGDTNAYGAGSDDLAAQWGAGKIDPALAAKLVEFARDNVVTEWSPVYSAQELADGIAAGGIGIGSGFAGVQRDARRAGFLSAGGRLASLPTFAGRSSGKPSTGKMGSGTANRGARTIRAARSSPGIRRTASAWIGRRKTALAVPAGGPLSSAYRCSTWNKRRLIFRGRSDSLNAVPGPPDAGGRQARVGFRAAYPGSFVSLDEGTRWTVFERRWPWS
jgi:hypothetical protein